MTNAMPFEMNAPNGALLRDARIHVSEQFLGFDSKLYYNVPWPDFLIDSITCGKSILSNSMENQAVSFKLTGQQ